MNAEVIKNCAYSTTVMAATPASPAYFSISLLNIKVVMETAMLFTISDEPLAQLCRRTLFLKTGRTKHSVPLRLNEKYSSPASAGTA